MATFRPGLFGGDAPRVSPIRRLQPQQVDMLGYAPQLMAQPTEQRRPRFTAQDAQTSNEPALGPVANTPTFPLFGSSAPKSGTIDPKKAVPMAGQSSGYEPGKRDWWKEISSDPLGFFLTGTDGLSQKREEGILSDYARQTAEESAQKRQARVDEAGLLGLEGRDANLYINAPDKYYEAYAKNQEQTKLGKGERLVPGFGGDEVYNQEWDVYNGQVGGTNADGSAWVWGERQDKTPEQITAEQTLAATIDKNRNDYSLGQGRLKIDGDRLAFDRDEAERKATYGDPEFTAAQNARIYSDSMDAVDEAMKNQGRLDTIARTALQFVESAKDYNSQGEGWWNDLGQALSMDTTGLKQLTDTIAPLIREPGSGGNSDADVAMFKSSVVSINNPKQANVRFANGAQALAGRNKEFVTYLSDAIDPNDPKSRQNANKIWLAYASENPLFDPNTGEVKAPPKFKDWLDIKTGRAVAPVTTSPMQMRTDRGVETIPAQSWSAVSSGGGRPGPTAPTAPMDWRSGPSPAAPQPVQSQQPPPGVDPDDWQFMTPEQRALFQ